MSFDENDFGSIKFELFSWLIVIILIFVWTSQDALRSLIGAYSAKPIAVHANYKDNELSLLEVKRGLQKHFLSFGVYVPIDDFLHAPVDLGEDREAQDTLRKVCGDHPLVVWLPLKFKLPFIGERAVEWCWKPTLTKS